jgi:hypothetical protein
MFSINGKCGGAKAHLNHVLLKVHTAGLILLSKKISMDVSNRRGNEHF